MKKSDLPNSSQFSPTQTPLPQLLEIVKNFEPNREEITQKILARFYPGSDIQLAKNTIIAMSRYGLVNKPEED